MGRLLCQSVILRGVALLGIDSVMAPKELRLEAWNRIVADLDLSKLEAITTEIGFDDIIGAAKDIVEGNVDLDYLDK